MGMIPQDMSENQESAANVLRDVLSGIPAALSTGGECIYMLVKDISKELEGFIYTGMTDKSRLHALSREDERAVAECCGRHGLTLNYCSQCLEYMHRKVTVAYPQIRYRKGAAKVLLIPWFTLPDRLYPVFTYIYAIWHYNASGKKSQRLSAAAAGKVFGIDSFHKSTVCRNIKAMEGLAESIMGGSPAPDEKSGKQAAVDVIESIPEILKHCPTAAALKESLGGTVFPMPEHMNNTQKPGDALSSIPLDYSKAIVEPPHSGSRQRDTRKRPPRPYRRPGNHVQRPLRFADSAKIRRIRRDFIAACRDKVIDTATAHHKFLL